MHMHALARTLGIRPRKPRKGPYRRTMSVVSRPALPHVGGPGWRAYASRLFKPRRGAFRRSM